MEVVGNQSMCLAGARRTLGWCLRQRSVRERGKFRNVGSCQAKAQEAPEVGPEGDIFTAVL